MTIFTKNSPEIKQKQTLYLFKSTSTFLLEQKKIDLTTKGKWEKNNAVWSNGTSRVKNLFEWLEGMVTFYWKLLMVLIRKSSFQLKVLQGFFSMALSLKKQIHTVPYFFLQIFSGVYGKNRCDRWNPWSTMYERLFCHFQKHFCRDGLSYNLSSIFIRESVWYHYWKAPRKEVSTS